MAKPTSLPSQAIENAAPQAQDHLPTTLPPATSPDVSLPEDALDHIVPTGLSHLPDFPFG